ncbi:MAG: L,D-transpeptidase [Oscillospiraceae bacterium]|nr:L,D-transpeptidase [Oscillospiraceae bacterium]
MGQMKKTKGVLNKQVVGIILLAVAIMAVVLVVLFSSGIFSGKSKVDKNSASTSAPVSSQSTTEEKTTGSTTEVAGTTKATSTTTKAPTSTTTKNTEATKTSQSSVSYNNPGSMTMNGTKYLYVSDNIGYVDGAGKVTFKTTDEYKKNYNYCVAVNRVQNVVTVYEKDANGEYTKPIKAMLCSCGIKSNDGGIPTPAGSFLARRKDRWLCLLGGVWGQYTTGVYQAIYFHSVPYYTQDNSNLQYNEFGKLGSPASHGCIRLSTADSKWIYDNLPKGGLIFIYDSNVAGPLGKPSNVPFDVNDVERRGWDPTDPDPLNPWKQ